MTPKIVRRPHVSLSALTVLLAALTVPVFAEETGAASPKDDKTEPVNLYMQAARKSDSGKAKVYTNDDLKQLYGGSAQDEVAATGGDPGAGEEVQDPLKQLFERQAKRAEHQQKIVAAEARVAAAQTKIADLEKRKLALRNPFLPRPVGPEEKTDEWKALGAAERLKRTEEENAAARAEVQKLEAELDTLRRSAP